MSKQIITTHGEDVLVREDTAKSFRGVYWALITFGMILAIMMILLLGGFISLSGNADTNPAEIEKKARPQDKLHYYNDQAV